MYRCLCCIRGSGVVSCADDVLEMSVVRRVRCACGVCEMFLARGGVGVKGLGLCFTNPVGTGGVCDMCLCLRWRWYWGRSLGGWGGVMSVCCESSFCIWQVLASVYYAKRIPAHLKCTQCSILLHLVNIGFLQCNCMWQISQIQTCLRVVVGPGLVVVVVHLSVWSISV